jgi:hypothetical protein
MVKTNIHLANVNDVFKSGIHLEKLREKNLSTTCNLAKSQTIYLVQITVFWDGHNSLLWIVTKFPLHCMVEYSKHQ